MAMLETVMKEVIARGARKQVRLVVIPLRREVVRLRTKLKDLQASVLTLRQGANGWKRFIQRAQSDCLA